MSIWTRITEALAALASGEGLGAVFDRLRAASSPEKSVGFTIAILALAAKMAKADGTVTRDEVSTFRAIFTIPKAEESNAARVFDLARQDVAGFDSYARKVAALFNPTARTLCADDHNILIDILEALFAIAMAYPYLPGAQTEWWQRRIMAAIWWFPPCVPPMWRCR